MADDTPSLTLRITRSVKGHIRTAGIALVFGLTAYGFIHGLVWLVRYVENM